MNVKEEIIQELREESEDPSNSGNLYLLGSKRGVVSCVLPMVRSVKIVQSPQRAVEYNSGCGYMGRYSTDEISKNALLLRKRGYIPEGYTHVLSYHATATITINGYTFGSRGEEPILWLNWLASYIKEIPILLIYPNLEPMATINDGEVGVRLPLVIEKKDHKHVSKK
jgi:hypothetical protein